MNDAPFRGSLSDADTFADLGVTRAYARLFVDAGALMLSDTTACSTPDLMLMGILTFADPLTIAGHLQSFIADFRNEFFDIDHQDAPVTGLGDEAVGVAGHANLHDVVRPAHGAFVRSGFQFVYAMTYGTPDISLARAIVGFILSHQSPPHTVAFRADGTSTGGDFARMPTPADIRDMRRLTSFMDMDLLEP